MENNVKKALSDFVEEPEVQEESQAKKVILDEREGLIERVDKILVTIKGINFFR